MNSKSSVLALASMLASIDNSTDILSMRGTNPLRPEDVDVRPKKKPIPKGCKVFEIEGVSIVALNEKSAVKKFNKLKNK